VFLTGVFRMMMVRVATENGFAFEVRVPNATTGKPCNPLTKS